MSKGRRPGTNVPAEINVTAKGEVQEAFDAANVQAQRMEQLRPVLGDLVDRTEEALWLHLDFVLEDTAQKMLELGRVLLALKEKTPHGLFGERLERRGMTFSAANKFMRASLKFAESANLKDLSKSKLLELAVLDQEDIKELDAGGTVAGLTLDDVSRMGVLELRKALRDERDARAEADAMVEKKNKKIDELDAKLTRRGKKPQWDEQAKEFSKAQRAITDLNEENILAQAGQIEQMTEEWAELPDDQRSALAHAISEDVNRVLSAAFALQNLVTDHVAIHARQRATARD